MITLGKYCTKSVDTCVCFLSVWPGICRHLVASCHKVVAMNRARSLARPVCPRRKLSNAARRTWLRRVAAAAPSRKKLRLLPAHFTGRERPTLLHQALGSGQGSAGALGNRHRNVPMQTLTETEFGWPMGELIWCCLGDEGVSALTELFMKNIPLRIHPPGALRPLPRGRSRRAPGLVWDALGRTGRSHLHGVEASPGAARDATGCTTLGGG